jgi:hypothetical protein
MWHFGIADVVVGTTLVLANLLSLSAGSVGPVLEGSVNGMLALFALISITAGGGWYMLRGTWLTSETRKRNGVNPSCRFRDLLQL